MLRLQSIFVTSAAVFSGVVVEFLILSGPFCLTPVACVAAAGASHAASRSRRVEKLLAILGVQAEAKAHQARLLNQLDLPR